MAARLAEHIDQQVGGAIDALRNVGEVMLAADIARDLQHPSNAIEVAAARGLELSQQIERTKLGSHVALVGAEILTELPGETEMAGVFRLAADGPFGLMLPEVVGLGVYPADAMPTPLTPSGVQVLAFAGYDPPRD